jgi:CRISPR-associated exonuclease Cas4
VIALLAVLLVGCVVAYLVLRGRWRSERHSLGLPDGAIVGADSSRLTVPTLRSNRYALSGRPDHLIRDGGMLIPVEHKPSATRLRESHVLQVAAECLLVQETYKRRPAYGVVVLAGGVSHRVPFTDDLEHRLLRTMAEMREYVHAGEAPGRKWVSPKCRACGFHETCWPHSVV